MAGYSMEKSVVVALQTNERLKAIYDFLITIKDEDTRYLEIVTAFESAQAIYDSFQVINNSTLLDESNDLLQTLFKRVVEIDQQFNKVKAIYRQIVKSESLLLQGNNLTLNQADSCESVRSEGLPQSKSNVRLPRINLPHFDGSLKDWPAFYDLFRTLIHQNDSLSDIEKFQYLVSTLSKEPLSIVKHLPLTSDNYTIAYDTLVDRYQNDRVLMTFYWQSIANSAKVSSDSPQALRRLVDTFVENITALNNCSNGVDLWDFTLFNLFVQKLDNATHKRFELSFDQTKIPSFEDVKQFVIEQCRALETNVLTNPNHLGYNQTNLKVSRNPSYRREPRHNRSAGAHSFLAKTESDKAARSPPARQTSVTNNRCAYCHKPHSVDQCSSFVELTPYHRYLAVRSAKLCHRCLSNSHSTKACSSSLGCQYCGDSHHSLLHFKKSGEDHKGSENSSEVDPINSTPVQSLTTSLPVSSVVLSTILLEIQDRWGNFNRARALCDSGSQSSFITASLHKRLGLPRQYASVKISGLGQVAFEESHGRAIICIRPFNSTVQEYKVDAIILKSICSPHPNVALPCNKKFDNLKLADPFWNIPSGIDLLLGADFFSRIVRSGAIASDGDNPAAMNTTFGWLLLGPSMNQSPSVTQSFFVSKTSNLDASIKAFWEVEEIPYCSQIPPEDAEMELWFSSHCFRDESGRFNVPLPFKEKEDSRSFPDSRDIADRRQLALERRLTKQPDISRLYVDFMKDYLEAGHMSLCHPMNYGDNSYYIPHHCVIKDDRGAPKIRVVFDASARACNGISLNDSLYAGPKLQNDITKILLRFRAYAVVFMCDIRQMYRQINIQESHRRYQMIRYRFSPDEDIRTYQLNTVTYGVSSSPYLAIRCMLQLSKDSEVTYPLASTILRQDRYVDDIVTGADELETALQMKSQLLDSLKTAHMELRKWASNHQALLSDLPVEHRQGDASVFGDKTSSVIKILGLQWSSSLDSFTFQVRPIDSACTKRHILSEISKIYDPLGFLCPVTFRAKHLIQHLWLLGLEWDAKPPDSVCVEWQHYKRTLPFLASLSIPRCIKPKSCASCELHGFSDASELGYAAVIYLRFIDVSGSISVSFITAKSRVAPLKRLSIPRLELCGAMLLSKLIKFVCSIYEPLFPIDRVFAWCDSSVALTWIKSAPHRWKTFVANRVSYIQERVPPNCWRHVGTKDNPADPASRGMYPEDLLSCSLWWAGPHWLKDPANSWPSSLPNSDDDYVTEEERHVVLLTQTHSSGFTSLLDRFSSLRKILRIIAYSLRFICSSRTGQKFSGCPVEEELNSALMIVVKQVQNSVFSELIDQVRRNKPLNKTFRKLSPFVDTKGILRVGGRLFNADLSYEHKHPALLPSQHRLSEMIISDIHNRFLHPGVNTTLYLVEQQVWIMGGRKLVKKCIGQCYKCFRSKPITYQPSMAALPTPRVTQAKPFSRVGVDYGGPFQILLSRRRGARTQKAYICLFVCFVTKALHIEVASDLSTEAFLAALRRFVSRRGRCTDIYSDCGTNFIGARRILQDLMKSSADVESIRWHLNPPAAPHFGGLWEAGIKSVKAHLSRVVGKQVLTYEELNTVVIQIEAVLNSRPLCTLSRDPNDLTVLTPGHFLTLAPLTAVPDSDVTEININRLSRWQLVQRLQQDFWKRWKNEYLHNLYQKGKWSTSRQLQPADVGILVLIKEELTPPLHWRIGRIKELHPGADGVNRVATVYTAKGLLKRPLTKLCPLPAQ